jgi:ABC-type dipeptide/oligopeptide/nickel transport system permease subunit
MTAVKVNDVLGSLGLGILAILVTVAIFAPQIAPYDPHDTYKRMEHPSSEHLLGTNDIGNDILSEVIYGTRVSLFIAFIVSITAITIGTSLGLIAGYSGGVLGFLIMRIVDIFLTIPRLVLIIVIAAFMPRSIWTMIVVFIIFGWVMTARIVRSEVMTLRSQYYVDSAKMLGGSDLYILWRHILPNVIPLVVVQFIMEAGHVIIAEAGLSFLGLGDPVARSWGTTFHYAFEYQNLITSDVWMWWMLPPGLCIVATVLGFTFVGYALEERLNPKLRTVVGMEL